MEQKIVISERAALARLNRFLRNESQVCRRSRSAEEARFYIVDTGRNCLTNTASETITPWLKENGLLKEWEQVEGE